MRIIRFTSRAGKRGETNGVETHMEVANFEIQACGGKVVSFRGPRRQVRTAYTHSIASGCEPIELRMQCEGRLKFRKI